MRALRSFGWTTWVVGTVPLFLSWAITSAAAPSTAPAPADLASSLFGDLNGCKRVVFVVDASGSMLNKSATVKTELATAIDRLDSGVAFSIVAFQDNRAVEMGEACVPADAVGKRRANAFLDGMTTSGVTNPVPAMNAAFRLRPDRICFITDGDIPDEWALTSEVDRLLRRSKSRIDTTVWLREGDFLGPFVLGPFASIRTMADRSGGSFRCVKDSDQEPAPGRLNYRLMEVPARDLPTGTPVTQPAGGKEPGPIASPTAGPAGRPSSGPTDAITSIPGSQAPARATPRSVFDGLDDVKKSARVIFLCGSFHVMLQKESWPKTELQTAVEDLDPAQSFDLLFASDRAYLAAFPGGVLVSATPANKRSAVRFLDNVTIPDEPDPMPGLEKAFDAGPQTLYLFTDGNLPKAGLVAKRLRELNGAGKVQVNTIVLRDDRDEDPKCVEVLKRIAAENGGTYRHATPKELEK